MSSSKPTPIRRRRRSNKPKLVTAAPAVDSSLAVDLPDDEEQDTDDLPEAAALQVDIPPAEPQHGSFLDRAKAKLGIADKPDVEPKAKASSGRLTKGQQEFVNLVGPIASQAGVMAADFAWGKMLDPHYVPYLSPSEEVADKIMLPLTRIAARMVSIKYKGHVSPNQIDAAASITAVVGYTISSLKLYSEIRNWEAQNGTAFSQEEINGARPVQPRSRYARGAVVADRQAGYVAPTPEPVHSADVEAVPAGPVPGENGRNSYPGQPSGVDLSSLTPEQRTAYEKLRSLSVRDYESRRRRSGYTAGV